jgi:hypothetical protein
MTITEMHQYFRVGVDKAESFSYPSFEIEEIDYFLNKAQERFIKQRYGINNIKGQGFEQTQKRTDDIREVIMYNNSSSLDRYLNGSNTDDNKPYSKYYTLPNTAPASASDPGDVYWFSIQEEAEVVYTDAASSSYTINSTVIPTGTYIVTETLSYDGEMYYTGESFVFAGASFSSKFPNGTFKSTKSKRVGVKPIQHDDYNKVVNDPFNKPNHDQALRLMLGDKIEIITEADFDITKFYMRYVRKPLAVDFANTVDCELADHTHEEIVDIAVSIALEDIESGRYQTNLNELNKNE